MPTKEATRTKKARRGTQTATEDTTTIDATTRIAGTAAGTVNDPRNSLALRTETTHGMVTAYSVDAERLMIKLDVSAIRRMLISVSADAPQFRSAVSMTILAHHQNERIYVKYVDDPRRVLRADGLEVYPAAEVGLGEDALDLEGWPFKYTG